MMMRGTIVLFVCVLCLVTGSFLFSAFAVKAQENPKWFVCERDADCIPVGAACAVGAVNTVYQEEAHSYYMGLNARMDCATALKSSDLKAECRENKCELIMNKEQVPAHD
jgi:hypothetical protein